MIFNTHLDTDVPIGAIHSDQDILDWECATCRIFKLLCRNNNHDGNVPKCYTKSTNNHCRKWKHDF